MKKKHRASPIILAVLCAVWVHTILFTDAGHRMQGAITEASTEVSDSILILDGNTISLAVQKDIPSVSKIAASLVYDNESITLSQGQSVLGKITQTTEDYSNNMSITIASPKNLTKGTIVATWEITKSLPEIHTINLSEVQIESWEGNISLSTQGTGEF